MKYLVVFILIFSLYAEERNLDNAISSATVTQGETPENKPPEKNVIDIDNSFITKFEYGKMLYNNPRGIGCKTCHGDKAEGKRIVNFKHEEKNKMYNCSLIVPSLTETDYETFYTKVNEKKNPNLKFEKEDVCNKLIYYANVMPTYFLVDDEIEAIYYYVQKIK